MMGLFVVPVSCQDWIPVDTEIDFEARVEAGIESGEYEVVVRNDLGVSLDVSLGLNFESIPTELVVEGYEVEKEYEDVEGSQYFVYFELEPGESESVGIRYSRPNRPSENFWEREYSYNSPVKFVFGAEDGRTYYERASYTGELVLDEVDLVKCRDCEQDGSRIFVEEGRDFSVDWSVQKVPVRPAVVYFVFGRVSVRLRALGAQQVFLGAGRGSGRTAGRGLVPVD